MKTYKDLEPGIKVTIYTNPVSEENVEGDATLIKKVGNEHYGIVKGHPMERWKVRFHSDGWTGERFIVNHFKEWKP